jgi:hypothetical protein
MHKILLPGPIAPGLLLGAHLASISAHAGGRPINRGEQIRSAVIWSCLAFCCMQQQERPNELRSIWVYPTAVAAGWLTTFGVITASEFVEEAPMMFYHFRRDFRKNLKKLHRRFSRA